MAAWIVAGMVLALGAPSSAEAADSKAEPAVVAEKCKCGNAADCTCKKGQCECKKCGPKRFKVFDSLKEGQEPRKLPSRRDATAGVFI